MTTEPTMNPKVDADNIDVEMTMEETMVLKVAQRATTSPSITASTAAESGPVFKPLATGGLDGVQRNDTDMILDIPVQLVVELGHTKMPIKNLLQLVQGPVVELDVLAGELMDVLVNGHLIAQGEVMVVNEKSDARLTGIITLLECTRKLNR